MGEQQERDIEPSRDPNGECRSLVLAQQLGCGCVMPDCDDAEGLGDLLERLGGGQAVDLLRIETAKAQHQELFDIT